MIVMTDGLKELAGAALRGRLIRFTRSPATGALSGAATTAILQSSSATTVAAVGFVGAGLLTFPEALGIIFGANIGTTITGWMVALLGFKLKLGTFVMPLILIGAILRLFAKGRLKSVGYAIAGFGLIFVGISFMQQGMDGISQFMTPDVLPQDTLAGRIKLVLLGIVITIITQSSSAGVAGTLAALYAGAVNFEQAAAMVIGMDIGTTVTALIASIGGSIDSRRTAISHVSYNLITGTGALILITPYMLLWEFVAPGTLLAHAEVALVAFHTSFNTIGVMIAVPFAKQFARLMKSLVPGQGPAVTRRLDKALLEQPELALKGSQETVRTELLVLLKHVNAMLGQTAAAHHADMIELQHALEQTQEFVDRIHLSTKEDINWNRLVAIIHSLDHLQRLHERCEEENRASIASTAPDLEEGCQLLVETNTWIIEHIEANQWVRAARMAADTAERIHRQVEPLRSVMMNRVASGEIDVPTGTNLLEAIRWLRRVSIHVARITEHYEKAMISVGE